LNFDRRSFLASSALVSFGAFHRKIDLFDLKQQINTPKEKKSMSGIPDIPLTSHHRVEADGVNVFYREAGSADALRTKKKLTAYVLTMSRVQLLL
jgi:hypothetical protein